MSHDLPASFDGDSRDPLRRMRLYTLAEELAPDAWNDAQRLAAELITQDMGKQLYSSVCSIAANTAEAYSRISGRDRAKIFEYALGSVRESMSWYRASKPVLGQVLINERLDRLEEMRRLLLAIIPRERARGNKRQ